MILASILMLVDSTFVDVRQRQCFGDQLFSMLAQCCAALLLLLLLLLYRCLLAFLL
jgi:hypothetical protein